MASWRTALTLAACFTLGACTIQRAAAASEEAKQVVQCTDAAVLARDRMFACHLDRAEEFALRSSEPADVLAEAAIGLCSELQRLAVERLDLCINNRQRAQEVIQDVVLRYKPRIIGEIVKQRVKAGPPRQ